MSVSSNEPRTMPGLARMGSASQSLWRGGAIVDAQRSRHAGMHNRVVLGRIGPTTLVNFGLLAAIGGMLATWLGLARQHQAGMEPGRYVALLFGTVPLLAVLGSRAFSIALDWRGFLESPLEATFKPGFAFHGGFLGALVGVVGVALYARVDLLMLCDAMALGFPLGHAIGRLGCHTYGCCHGKPTASPVAIRYTNPDSKAVRCSDLSGVPLHPTQLYSAVGNVGLFVLLNVIAFCGVRDGQITATYLIVGSAARFAVEFLRGIPSSRVLGLTPFQWVAAGMVVCGIGLLQVVSGNPVHDRFSDPVAFLHSLRYASQSIYPAWVFVVIFASFGIHGRDVGSFGSGTS